MIESKRRAHTAAHVHSAHTAHIHSAHPTYAHVPDPYPATERGGVDPTHTAHRAHSTAAAATATSHPTHAHLLLLLLEELRGIHAHTNPTAASHTHAPSAAHTHPASAHVHAHVRSLLSLSLSLGLGLGLGLHLHLLVLGHATHASHASASHTVHERRRVHCASAHPSASHSAHPLTSAPLLEHGRVDAHTAAASLGTHSAHGLHLLNLRGGKTTLGSAVRAGVEAAREKGGVDALGHVRALGGRVHASVRGVCLVADVVASVLSYQLLDMRASRVSCCAPRACNLCGG